MVRYFYAWTPLLIVGTVALLSAPWLGLIALLIAVCFAVVAVVALTWAIVSLPMMLGRAVRRRRHAAGRTGRWTATPLSPAGSDVRSTRSAPAAATVLLANPRADADR
jgi:hypothetical protein